MINYDFSVKRIVSASGNYNQLWLVMKLTSILLLWVCMHVSAASISQTVTLKVSNKPLVEVLTALKKQTNYRIMYNDRFIRPTMLVTVDVKSRPLEEVLSKLLVPQNLTYHIEGKTIAIRPNDKGQQSTTKLIKANNSQEHPITGRVRDESGAPIAGVTVQVKGSSIQTMTAVDGTYSISIASARSNTAILVFSNIGFSGVEIAIKGRKDIDVTLLPIVGSLDEVVVVGMNLKQSKRSVTGAMSTIETKELKQSPVANLNNALAGRVPGLISVQSSGQPGEDAAALYIRGIATYGANRSPLIVIDGLPRSEGSFSQIDPNEVESVSILKDASSSALYGIQGANGVIVVTTKRGRNEQKPLMDFTAQSGWQQVMRLPERPKLFSMANFYNEIDINAGKGPRFSEQAMQIIEAGADPYLYPDVNWFDEILKKASMQNQYNLNISGSTNKVKYFVSGSHINQGTILKHDDLFYDNYGKKSGYNRYNFRSNIDIQATDRLSVQVDLAGRLEKRTGPSSGFFNIFDIISGIPTFALPVFNPDGSLGAASNVEIPFWQNPYGMATQSGYYENSTNVMYGTLSAKHDLGFIVPGLSAQGYFSFENNNYNQTSRIQEYDQFWFKGLDNNDMPLYQQTRIASTLGTAGANTLERSTYLDIRMMYAKDFGVHHLDAQVLGNRTLRVLNQELPYAYQGISGRMGYGYADKYFFESNLSYNGSENFPTEKRYGFFPSVSAAWVVSEESFFKTPEVLKYLKLRGSFGIAGNDKIGGQRWLYQSDFGPDGGYNFGVSPTWRGGYKEKRVGNPFVTWEHSKKSNIGFELALFKNSVVQIVFDVFKERRTNILTDPGTVPEYLGLTNLAPLNSGIVENKGYDGEIKVNKRLRNDLSFFVNLQMTYAKNKVIQNDQPLPKFDYQDLRGYEVGYQLGYKNIGFFNSQEEIDNSPKQSFDNKLIPGDIKYRDINNDNIINEYDRVPIQVQNIPRLMSGLSAGISYKRFDLSFLLNGAKGGTEVIYPSYNDNWFIEDRWTPTNKENARAPVAKVSVNNRVSSDFYMVKTDYLKLRNLEIGCNLPHIIKGLKEVRVFVNGQNLAIWDRLPVKDRDPESAGGYWKYPIQRIFNAGLNFKL